MKDNYAFKQRLTCILSNIIDSAWCNYNYKPLPLFGFKSVLRMGELKRITHGKERICSQRRKRGNPDFFCPMHSNTPYSTEATQIDL